MPKKVRQVSITTRTREMYATAKRRAGGQLTYTLGRFRDWVERILTDFPFCPFCHKTMHAGDVSLDHKTPIGRGGHHGMDNLMLLCLNCNKAKGSQTAEEFTELMKALDNIGVTLRNPGYRDGVVATLRTGNSFRLGANRRAKQAR